MNGLAARKQARCQDWLAAHGVGVFPGTADPLGRLRVEA